MNDSSIRRSRREDCVDSAPSLRLIWIVLLSSVLAALIGSSEVSSFAKFLPDFILGVVGFVTIFCTLRLPKLVFFSVLILCHQYFLWDEEQLGATEVLRLLWIICMFHLSLSRAVDIRCVNRILVRFLAFLVITVWCEKLLLMSNNIYIFDYIISDYKPAHKSSFQAYGLLERPVVTIFNENQFASWFCGLYLVASSFGRNLEKSWVSKKLLVIACLVFLFIDVNRTVLIAIVASLLLFRPIRTSGQLVIKNSVLYIFSIFLGAYIVVFLSQNPNYLSKFGSPLAFLWSIENIAGVGDGYQSLGLSGDFAFGIVALEVGLIVFLIGVIWFLRLGWSVRKAYLRSENEEILIVGRILTFCVVSMVHYANALQLGGILIFGLYLTLAIFISTDKERRVIESTSR